MKSFLYKVNVENFETILKYNNLTLDEFLKLNKNTYSPKEIFYILKKYKNVLNDKKTLRNTLLLLHKNDVMIQTINFTNEDIFQRGFYNNRFYDYSGLLYQMKFCVNYKFIDIIFKPLNSLKKVTT